MAIMTSLARELFSVSCWEMHLSNVFIIFKLMQIKSVHEDGSVVFQDGSILFADVILHCTGYALQIQLGFG